jgi:hypothetical protein
MVDPAALKRKKLGKILAVAFVAVLAMGAGPGLLLINPDISDPNVSFTFLGLPKVYAWGLLCYGLEVAIVVTAYFKVWHVEDEGEAS